MKLFPVLLVGGLVGLIASAGNANSSTVNGYVPDSVIARINEALASGDPVKMRTLAAQLRKEGYSASAIGLEKAAAVAEGATPAPAPSTTTTPPVKPPAATNPPATNPPATTVKPPTSSPPVVVRPPSASATPTSSPVAVNTALPKELQGSVYLKRVAAPEPYDKRVELWQDKLRALGFRSPTTPSDGKFGVNTDTQTRAFQRAKALSADGVVGPDTLAAAWGSKPAAPAAAQKPVPAQTAPQLITPLAIDVATWRPIMKYGQSGKDILEWQSVVVRDGFKLASGADSFFGKETEGATKGWQTTHGLQPDGIVGKDVRAKLTGTYRVPSAVAGIMVGLPAFGSVELGDDGLAYGDDDLGDDDDQHNAPLPKTSSGVAFHPDDLSRLARELAEHIATTLEGQEDRDRIELFQRTLGLNATGAYGPATAEAIASFGVLPPPPRAWPTKKVYRAKTKYRSALRQHAQRDPERAAEWLRASAV